MLRYTSSKEVYNLYMKKFNTSLKLSIRLFLSTVLYYSGATKLYRRIKRKKGSGGITILAYHDIARESHLGLQVPSRVFDRHMNYLREQNYNIIGLDEAADILASGRKIPPDSVAITFDDGYKSIYTTVFPIVRKYGIPITVFVSIKPVEENCALFVDSVIYGINSSLKPYIDLTLWDMTRLPLTSKLYKEKASREIINRSKAMPQKERQNFLDFIFSELGVDRNAEGLKDIMLNWNEIKELSKNGVPFGAHTVNHPCLAGIPLKDAEEEICDSRKILEEKIGKEVKSFAYPFGSKYDITKGVRSLVEKAGFRCACVLGGGDNKDEEDPFLLKRKNITDHIKHEFLVPFSKADFAVQMSGIIPSGSDKELMIDGKGEERINILYIIDQLRGMAGTERHLLYLVSRLNKERYNCYIGTFDGGRGAMPQAIRESGIPMLDLGLNRIYSPDAPLKALRLWRFIRKKKIDLVQTYHFKSDTFGVLVARLSGVTSIISSKRDMGDLKSPRQIMLSNIMNRYIDNYISVCDKVGRKFHELENISMDKMLTIYNGVDLQRFDPGKGSIKSRKDMGFKKTDFIVGTTAIFRPEKAYHILFEAIEKVSPQIKNLKIMIMGFGPRYDYFVNYCNSRSLKDVVRFMGRVNDVENYLPIMDVFCLVPNRNEGFSNAILEAMAMGRPIIATDIGGNAEAVVDNETGFIIPPDNSDELASRIMLLYENAAKRREMGEKARQRAIEVFSLEAMIKRHEDLYEELYASTNPSMQKKTGHGT